MLYQKHLVVFFIYLFFFKEEMCIIIIITSQSQHVIRIKLNVEAYFFKSIK